MRRLINALAALFFSQRLVPQPTIAYHQTPFGPRRFPIPPERAHLYARAADEKPVW